MRRFACLLLLAAPAWSAGAFFNILDYGAHNDGSAPATEAIRAAVQAAKAAGGGTVFIPAGNYVSGPIELVSNLTLHVDAGATVRFPAARLPFTEGRQQSIEALTPVPLIGGRHLENVAITGRGVLASDNAEWMKLMPRQKAAGSDPGSANGPNWERLLELLEIHTPAPRVADAPVVRLDRSPGAIVRASRAFEGTGTFLSTGPGELKGIVLEGNVLGSARNPTAEAKADYWKSAEPATEAERE